jgi:Fe-S oxidoreductase
VSRGQRSREGDERTVRAPGTPGQRKRIERRARLVGAIARGPATDECKPDIAFYIGCNVGKTPHIVLLCVVILQAMGFSCEIIGGSSACCGINQFRAGDGETAWRAGLTALSQIEAKQATTNISWCPSCAPIRLACLPSCL